MRCVRIRICHGNRCYSGFVLHSQFTCELYECNNDSLISFLYEYDDKNLGNAVRVLCTGCKVAM